MKKNLKHTLLLLVALLASLAMYACNSATTTPEPTKPAVTETVEETPATEPTEVVPTTTGQKVTISIWHGYLETEEKLFSKAVTDFMAANPNVTIDVLAVPFEELQNKFQTEVAAGGGPTLVTGPQDRMATYAQAGLLKNMDDKASFLADLLPASVNGGRIDGNLVGVPLNNKVVALFYNKSKIKSEPKDFDELLAMATENGLAITGDWFHNYMWGGAFGATFLDSNNAVILDSAEGAEAYAYLKKVCESDGVTCDGNDGDMDTLFRQGEAAFRIQGPWAAGPAVTDLGIENVGVMAVPPIPGHGAPRPWNQSEMISMNIDATAEQEAAAVSFISYLTSADVQKPFLDEGNWIPVNAKVDTASNPVVGGFLKQVPNSDPFPVVKELGASWEPMGNAMTQILEGVAEPAAALKEAAKLINEANNVVPGEIMVEPTAKPSEEVVEPLDAATIVVWHGYLETEEATFKAAAESFMKQHPEVKIELLAVPFEELQNKFQTEVAAGGGPTLVTGPQDRMAAYAEAGLLKEVPADSAFLGDLVPASVNGGRIDGKLVGIPLNNKVVALFYNKSKIKTEPKDFDELLAMAKENGLAITADWFHNYMWAPAFGATFLDKNSMMVLDQTGGADAYGYLKTVCESEGVTCDANDGDMDTLFRQGDAAFRIQGPWASGPAIEDLGAENVGVMAVPAVPGQEAPRPWNQSEMLSMNVDADEAQTAAALAFAKHLTGAEVQKSFLDAANWIPANAKVDTASNPVVGGFLKQVPNSDPFPVVKELGATWDPMGNAMTQILEGVAEPAAALEEAAKLINTANDK